jgi:UDP-N-acetylglucosamine acyltransferase
MPTSVHPTAIVEEGARLGADCQIHAYAIVRRWATLGDGVVVHPFAVVGGDPQDLKFDGVSPSYARVGARTRIRENVTINRGTHRDSVTTVGSDCLLMAGCHVAHDCIVGNSVTLSNGVQLAGHVQVGDGVIMGGLSAIQQFGRIGRYAFISGVTGVVADVIPYGSAVGTHARLYGLNLVGLRRRHVPRPNIHALRAAYRLIFHTGEGTIHANARRVGEQWPDIPEVQEVVSFILADAKRPICPARPRGREADDDE